MPVDVNAEIEKKLVKRGYTESKPHIWVKGESPHIRMVDMRSIPPEIGIWNGVELIKEGHGIIEIEDIKQEVLCVLHGNPDPGFIKDYNRLGVAFSWVPCTGCSRHPCSFSDVFLRILEASGSCGSANSIRIDLGVVNCSLRDTASSC